MHARHPLGPSVHGRHVAHATAAACASLRLPYLGSGAIRALGGLALPLLLALALAVAEWLALASCSFWIHPLPRARAWVTPMGGCWPSSQISRKARSTHLVTQRPQVQPSARNTLLLFAGHSSAGPMAPSFRGILVAACLAFTDG
ncbi:unnamed protein product [Prorocentrum cordatum]|uniref:Uncharacterized protein n=1 Tax=Prorocentrum cordatum TaxID=2364126 RepID=A0ABN9WZY2_9DINO|nr:unnamed protein product [Polarella glacialis]CAK0891284.1 unnamed protein product [Polarella glacialis]